MTDTHAFRHTPRKSLTDQQRTKFFLERGGKCEGEKCGGVKIFSKRWYVDHRIALENGGTNDHSNLQLLCEPCHMEKTGQDHARAAKIRAVAVSHYIPPSQRQKKGPPIPGSKRSPWKRRMDGTVVRRDAEADE